VAPRHSPAPRSISRRRRDARPFAEPLLFGVPPGWPHAGADFSSASSDFKALVAFFCNIATLSFLRLVSRSRARSATRPRTTSCGFAASEAYHVPARIQSFQAVAPPFPGDSFLPSASPAAIPATETSRSKRSKIGSAVSAGTAARTNIQPLRRSGKKFVERLGSYATLPNPKSFPQVFEGIFSSKESLALTLLFQYITSISKTSTFILQSLSPNWARARPPRIGGGLKSSENVTLIPFCRKTKRKKRRLFWQPVGDQTKA
jgi:hypothetical protein